MTPYYTDDWLTVWQGDCREVMAQMPAESVHTVVTSPPYWGLRDYGTATWLGGDDGCDHKPPPPKSRKFTNGRGEGVDDEYAGSNLTSWTYRDATPRTCKCGAIREDKSLGLEPTPEEYVANMVAVFREVRRVLRADGTVWLNLGSSYMSTSGNMYPQTETFEHGHDRYKEWARPLPKRGAGGSDPSQSLQRGHAPAYGTDGTGPLGSSAPGSAYPDLCDGCRAVLLPHTTDTHRPHSADASPPSPTDRDSEHPGSEPELPDVSPRAAPVSTTPQSEPRLPGSCSHCGACGACLEVLRSSSRDARACVRKSWLNYPTFKPKDMVPIPWMVAMALQADGWYLRSDIIWSKANPMPESVTDRPTKAHEYLFLLSKSAKYFYDADAVREAADPDSAFWRTHPNGQKAIHRTARLDGSNDAAPNTWLTGLEPGSGRNLRSVWNIATQPYPGAHFATFPEKLVEPCVKAGTSERGVCPECGAPWRRQTATEFVKLANRRPTRKAIQDGADMADVNSHEAMGFNRVTTTGWQRACTHPCSDCRKSVSGICTRHNGSGPIETAPAVVLDPFAGSGTTGRVAQRLGRRAVLIDLSGEYLVQAMKRNTEIPLGLESA